MAANAEQNVVVVSASEGNTLRVYSLSDGAFVRYDTVQMPTVPQTQPRYPMSTAVVCTSGRLVARGSGKDR